MYYGVILIFIPIREVYTVRPSGLISHFQNDPLVPCTSHKRSFWLETWLEVGAVEWNWSKCFQNVLAQQYFWMRFCFLLGGLDLDCFYFQTFGIPIGTLHLIRNSSDCVYLSLSAKFNITFCDFIVCCLIIQSRSSSCNLIWFVLPLLDHGNWHPSIVLQQHWGLQRCSQNEER